MKRNGDGKLTALSEESRVTLELTGASRLFEKCGMVNGPSFGMHSMSYPSESLKGEMTAPLP